MTNILAFDTATDACSVALQVGEKIYSYHEIAPRKHAQLLLSVIQDLISQAQIKLSDLNAIAFGCGPGSFMGVRFATGIAQGLGFGLNIPLIPISTLQIIAQTYFSGTPAKIISGWDARMGEIYWGFYVSDANGIMQPQQDDALCAPDQLDKKTWIELGCAFAGNVFSDHTYPDAKSALFIALSKYKNNEMVSAENAHPHYIRDQVTHNYKK